MRLFHVVERKSVGSVFREGLRYGARGMLSRDRCVARTNNYLDHVCPAPLAARGLSRNKCIYMYLAMADKVHDIRDGRLRTLRAWAAEQSQAVLAADVDASAYVSDLDAYDALLRAVVDAAPAGELERLAARYWGFILPLAQTVRYYDLRPDGLVRRDGSSGRLPPILRRAEVMVTRDIAPQALTLIKA